MDIKELNRFRYNQRKIAEYSALIDQAKAELEEIARNPATGYRNRTAQQQLKEQLKDVIKDYRSTIQVLNIECVKVIDTINSLEDPTDRAIMKMRYLQPRPEKWEEIADKLYFSPVWVQQRHKRILDKLKIK